ncbi:MAG: VanZ family protein [Pirellulaceae bacterium]|nr:VanZ family protein [Pirellulaceae bacterium]
MIQSTIRGVRLATILLCGYWCLLFIATHLPKSVVVSFRYSDKLLHFTAYAGLAFLLAWALPTVPKHKRLNILMAGFLAISYGVMDEISQTPVGRQADIMDWVADSCGAIVGLTFYAILRWQIVKRGRSRQAPSTTTLEALQV